MRTQVAFVLAAAMSLGGMQAASAADMPMKAPVYKAPVAAQYNWTGFYIGANAGYSWGTTDVDYSQAAAGGGFATGPCTAACTLSYTPTPDSFIGGLQLGYNYQAGIWVLGIETDFAWRDREDSIRAVLNGFADTLTITDRQKWVGTLRGNIGISPTGASNWLFYVTGGLAYGRFEHSVTQFCNIACNETITFSDATTKVGWTLGAGMSLALDRNWSVGAEYLYMDFGTDTLTSSAGVALPVLIPATSVDFHDHSHVARATLNYKFGS